MYEGYYYDEHGIFRNDVLINGLNSAEYIAENYAIESAIWFWGINEFRELNGEDVSLNIYVNHFENDCNEDILFLVTQYYVNGSPEYSYSDLENMCVRDYNVIIGEDNVNFEGSSAPEPNGWTYRKTLWDNWKEGKE